MSPQNIEFRVGVVNLVVTTPMRFAMFFLEMLWHPHGIQCFLVQSGGLGSRGLGSFFLLGEESHNMGLDRKTIEFHVGDLAFVMF